MLPHISADHFFRALTILILWVMALLIILTGYILCKYVTVYRLLHRNNDLICMENWNNNNDFIGNSKLVIESQTNDKSYEKRVRDFVDPIIYLSYYNINTRHVWISSWATVLVYNINTMKYHIMIYVTVG